MQMREQYHTAGGGFCKMCYKVLALVIFTLILLQYLYTSFPQAPAFISDVPYNLTRHEPLFLPSVSEASPEDVKNLSAWMYFQITPASTGETLPLCPLIPPNLLGHLGEVPASNPPPEPHVLPGGQWRPEQCRSRDRVALVVPYRDRKQILMTFLAHMHPFLQRQLLDYGLFVIEQAGTDDFNRAMLMNIGFVEALGMREFDCFIFHDVDLLPEDDRNLYTCPNQPRHMSVAVNVHNYRLPYPDIFGGVSAMTRAHFEAVNGFSNVFWGWGGEDDDMAARIKAAGLEITRYPKSIARYTMLPHIKQKANPRRFQQLYSGAKRRKTDGLNSLQYRRLELRLTKLFTWVLVELSRPPS
ncbi:beta-1,4-N-acetylgalactosaminyltransferase bre-4 isoform X2 [Halyomorpha halys]|uniref:beta-1,4-N-acetylgalactosaminyltransferase bre-4 isoform X2 n=2 Tax=Halyomorpha halys TaxID=286706 RepID=UPI0006D4D486|nr:beta-1,4-N-acetylgalactosaminyltransferase bre-4-like isoform X3 [Halyomorpha halys]